MSLINEVITVVGSYLALILIVVSAINIASSKWLFVWLRVKTSGGRKLLVHVRTVTQDYFKAGTVDKGFLVFKDSNKEERRILLLDDCIIKSGGVNNIYIDDTKSCVMKRNLEAVGGFDATKYNDLYLRALYKPQIYDNKEKILFAIVVVTLLAVLLVGYLVYANTGRVDALYELIGRMGSIKEVL